MAIPVNPVYGYNITDDVVEDAVLATLKMWTSSELSEIERQRGLTTGHYGRPRSWEVRNDFEKFLEDQLPLVLVISTGLASDPAKEGRSHVRAPWAIGVGVVASSTDQKAARRYAYRLGGAVRGALAHNQSLGKAIDGLVRRVTWVDSRNNELPSDSDRTIWAVRQLFIVEVAQVLTENAGPPVPDPDPVTPTDPGPNQPPTVGGVDITITRED